MLDSTCSDPGKEQSTGGSGSDSPGAAVAHFDRRFWWECGFDRQPEATLTRFQGMLREVFLSGQTSMTKRYLRFLVERIEVQPAPKRSVEVNIVGRSGAAVALIASTANGNQSRGEPVLGSVGSWLPKCASTENYASRVVVQLAEVRERKKRRSLAELRAEQAVRQEVRADEWRRALASGEVASRAALARREGVSRAWVTKVLGRSPLFREVVAPDSRSRALLDTLRGT